MQRAYAALGLPYGNQSPAQGQGGPGGQNTAQGGQQLRSINALGRNVAWSHWSFRLGYCKALEDNRIRASAEGLNYKCKNGLIDTIDSTELNFGFANMHNLKSQTHEIVI
jgi:hypothetical protein